MQYFISEGGKPAGPFTIEELRHRSVTPETLIWYEGLPDWVRADSIEAIRREILGNYPPYAPTSTSPGADAGSPYRVGGSEGEQPAYCPSTYLIPAILLSICCCNPIGIVAIVYALQVQPAYARGHYQQARDASDAAKRWCIIAAIAWVVIFGLFNVFNWPPFWPSPNVAPMNLFAI